MSITPTDIERRYRGLNSNDIHLSPTQRQIVEDLETLIELCDDAVSGEDYQSALDEIRNQENEIAELKRDLSIREDDLDDARRRIEDLEIELADAQCGDRESLDLLKAAQERIADLEYALACAEGRDD